MNKLLIFFKNNWQSFFVFFIAFILTISLTSWIFPESKSLLTKQDGKHEYSTDKTLHITSIGDSLTQGVGDETNSGGYIPYLSKELKYIYNFKNIHIENYGVSGNRTTQLINRIEKTIEIQKSIESSDIILITIGANDLLKIIKDNVFNDLKIEDIKEHTGDYINNLSSLYNTIRKYNNDCAIYQLGIYNPYYINFPDLTQMQAIVSLWNDTTLDLVESKDYSYFIPINDEIYQGSGIGPNSDINDLLSQDDYFHPNNTGYQIMAKVFRDKIQETDDIWLER